MKRILNIAFWIFIPIGILILLGFSNAAQNELLCAELNVHIDYENGMQFLSREDVVNRLRQSNTDPTGKKMLNVQVDEMEAVLMKIPEVQSVEVFKTIDGRVGVSIAQRRPIVRVINSNGRQFYIDDRGFQMPVSNYYFPHVPVVHGYISEPELTESAHEIAGDSLLRSIMRTDDIYAMANFITGNSFWNAQIQEIYFSRKGDMELIPIVGDHRIIFGDTSHMEEKFNKLMVFYKEGIKQTGWNRYDTINLKYKNQIVCSKK